jgi:hypothetical protein
MMSLSCRGFIFVPGLGFALRGGEDQIGTRTFLVSPDFALQPAATLPTPAESSAILLPAANGTGEQSGLTEHLLCMWGFEHWKAAKSTCRTP